MQHNTKNKIKSDSNLPIIAAVLSLVSIIFIVLSNRFYMGNIFGSSIMIVLPSLLLVWFAIFAIVYAKNKLVLMAFPVLLISLFMFLKESGVINIIYWGIDDYFDFLSGQVFIPLLSGFLFLGLLISAEMILLNVFNTRLASYIFCILNMTVIVVACIFKLFFRSYNYERMTTLLDTFGQLLIVAAILVLMVGIEGKAVLIKHNSQQYPTNSLPHQIPPTVPHPVNQGIYPSVSPVNQGMNTPIPAVNQSMKAPIPPVNQSMYAATPPINQGMNPPIPPVNPAAMYQNNQVNQGYTYQNGPMGVGNGFPKPQPPVQNQYDEMQGRLTENDIIVDKLRQLSILHSQGVINDLDFEQKKKELLSRI